MRKGLAIDPHVARWAPHGKGLMHGLSLCQLLVARETVDFIRRGFLGGVFPGSGKRARKDGEEQGKDRQKKKRVSQSPSHYGPHFGISHGFSLRTGLKPFDMYREVSFRVLDISRSCPVYFTGHVHGDG
jgi:hypothetical protein